MKYKKGYEFGFAWFFAFIVGAAIIFLAIYGAAQLIKTQRFQQETQSAREIGIILSPVETILEDSKFVTINLNEETKIFNDCNQRGEFGSQEIGVSIKSSVGNPWEQRAISSSFSNKYIFSEPEVYGEEEIYVLSKPLMLPFKIADLLIIYPDKNSYCFVNSPDEVSKEIGSAGFKNIELSNSLSSCNLKSKKICFLPATGNCDITIDNFANRKSVTYKAEGKTVYYSDVIGERGENALLYAAIFSSPEIYECQIERLLSRASKITELYKKESSYLQPSGCGAPILTPLFNNYQNSLGLAKSRDDIRILYSQARDLNEKNELLRGCSRLF